jgi:hypothetical protein
VFVFKTESRQPAYRHVEEREGFSQFKRDRKKREKKWGILKKERKKNKLRLCKCGACAT